MAVAVYPGQGAQSVGMGLDLFNNFKISQILFEEASDALSINFKRLLFEGPEQDLQLTMNTQPALLLTSVAAHRIAENECGFIPQAASGHSVGEYAALVGAQVLTFSQAMKAVRARGQAMQDSVPVGMGGMVATLGLELKDVETVCRWAVTESGLGAVEVANINAPGQVVISGHKAALDWLVANFSPEKCGITAARAKFIPLKVSAPFHCSLMKKAQDVMKDHFEDVVFQDAKFPVVQNVTGKPETSGTIIKKQLVAQISAPVQWIQCVKSLESYSDVALELGWGKVLNGLNKKISEKIKTISVSTLDDIKEVSRHGI